MDFPYCVYPEANIVKLMYVRSITRSLTPLSIRNLLIMLNHIVFIRKGNLLDNPINPVMRRPRHQPTKL